MQQSILQNIEAEMPIGGWDAHWKAARKDVRLQMTHMKRVLLQTLVPCQNEAVFRTLVVSHAIADAFPLAT